ncbi:MAG: hypothetical protein AB9869_35090 [Verrucomicrobiia bacterium]
MQTNERPSLNATRVRRYVARMKAMGWKKYSFLLPHDLAADFRRLKAARIGHATRALQEGCDKDKNFL